MDESLLSSIRDTQQVNPRANPIIHYGHTIDKSTIHSYLRLAEHNS